MPPLRVAATTSALLLLLAAWPAIAAPSGFLERVVADSLDSPVSMALAADGRIFVCQQAGALRVVRNGRLLPRPFVTVPTRAEQEEGLLGVALDPAFDRNGRVYLFYTALTPRRHDRVERYTASGDTALAGSARVVLELDDNFDHVHVGGALRFGADGRLFVGTGENGEGSLSQSLHSTHGKILRIEPDGAIPADNPFVTLATGRHRAIWARGLRNAFSLDVQPETGRLFVNDVGGAAWEEVDDVVAGGNYGWPYHEGASTQGGFLAPVHAYDHRHGCAIAGGAFYPATQRRFPAKWRGGYFFADYCANEIRWLDPGAPARAVVFATLSRPGPVDLRVAGDGALVVLVRGNSQPTGGPHSSLGSVLRIVPAGRARPARNR